MVKVLVYVLSTNGVRRNLILSKSFIIRQNEEKRPATLDTAQLIDHMDLLLY